jgi:hypothetical protein
MRVQVYQHNYNLLLFVGVPFAAFMYYTLLGHGNVFPWETPSDYPQRVSFF